MARTASFLLVVIVTLVVGAPAQVPDAAPLRVMTFNIRYGTAPDGRDGWKKRRDLVMGVIREFDPSVLGVQEALRFQLDELRETLGHLGEIGVARRDGKTSGEYCAILYDTRRIDVLDHATFWFSARPEVPGSRGWGTAIPRICTWGRFRVRDTDVTFYLYNVHWDHRSQESRSRSGELLAARIADRSHPDEPVLVTGDFNAGESNPAFRTLLANGLADTFRARHPEAREVGTFNGFEGTNDGEKIDAILMGDGWKVLEAGIVRSNHEGRYPSDHYPVTAVVKWE